MDVVKDIAALVGLIISAITLITLCSKGGRAWISSVFKKESKEIVEENKQQSDDITAIKADVEAILSKSGAFEEFTKQQCRNTIKNIYYKYYAKKKIPLYERKTVDKTYDLYVNKLKGNSYATLLYSEICKWEIDTVTYKDVIQEED